MSVHFPIALSFVAFGFYVYDLIKSEATLTRMGFWLHALSTLGAILAIFTGRNEKSEVPEVEELVSLVQTHEIFGYLFVWLMSMLLIWQYLRLNKMKSGEKIAFIVVFLACLGVLCYGSYLGGQMVFEHGVGVSKL